MANNHDRDDGMSDAVRGILASRPLTPYHGRDVIGCGIEIPGASGGLREALKFDPIEVDIDEERVLVMKIRCKKHRYDEIKDTDALRLVMIFEPLEDLTAFIDEELVKDVLQEQADRVRIAREEAVGIQRLSLEGDPEEADEKEVLVTQHNAGVHADGLRDGCPLCQDEVAAQAAEDGGDGGEPTPITKPRGRPKKRAEQ